MPTFFSSLAAKQSGEAARLAAKRLAKEKRVTVEVRVDGSWHELVLTAAERMTIDGDLHEMVIANAGPTTDGLWERARLALGEMRPSQCETPDCEWCAGVEA